MKAEIGEGDDDVRHWSRVVGGLARWWGDGVARLREMANKETQPRGLDAVARDRLRVYCHSKELGGVLLCAARERLLWGLASVVFDLHGVVGVRGSGGERRSSQGKM